MAREVINYQSNSQYLRKVEEINRMIQDRKDLLHQKDKSLSGIEANLQAIVQLMQEEKIPLVTLGENS